MNRTLVALLAGIATACGAQSEKSPITRLVGTVGYGVPPRVAVVRSGADSVTQAWSTSLRRFANVVVEISGTGLQDYDHRYRYPDRMTPETEKLCRVVAEAAAGAPIDEIVVLDASLPTDDDIKCIDEDCDYSNMLGGKDVTCHCKDTKYVGSRTEVRSDVKVLLASTCAVVASTDLPGASGSSSSDDGSVDAGHAAAIRNAEANFAKVPSRYAWSIFPRTFPRLDPSAQTACSSATCTHTYHLETATPMFESGQSYWIKEPGREMRPGAKATQVGPSATTMETTGDLTIHPRDELHVTEEQLHATAYLAAVGGTVRAESDDHTLVAAAAAARGSLERAPVFGEVRLEGSALTGFDLMRTASLGVALGFRLPVEPVVPVAFGEFGGIKAWQGDSGATANGGYLGVGVGAELWLARWFAFADLRRRWVHYDDWSDLPASDVKVDLTWIVTAVQLGVGTRF